MEIQGIGTIRSEKIRKRHRRITGGIIILLILLAGIYIVGILTSDGPEYQQRASAIEENHILKERITELEKRIDELEGELKKAQEAPLPEEAEAETQGEPQTPRD